MKVKKVAKVPNVISPDATCRPPKYRTKPIEIKKAIVMAAVFATRVSIRSWLSFNADVDATSNLAISCSDDAKARTTRMPARFSSIT